MPTIDWSKLIKAEYWLEGVAGNTATTPLVEKNSWFFWFFVVFFSTFFVVGILVRLIKLFLHKEHPLQKQLPFIGNNLISMGLLGLVWFTLRQTNVVFFGSRMWLLLGALWFLVVAYLVLRYFVIFFPLEIQYFRRKVLNKSN